MEKLDDLSLISGPKCVADIGFYHSLKLAYNLISCNPVFFVPQLIKSIVLFQTLMYKSYTVAFYAPLKWNKS